MLREQLCDSPIKFNSYEDIHGNIWSRYTPALREASCHLGYQITLVEAQIEQLAERFYVISGYHPCLITVMSWQWAPRISRKSGSTPSVHDHTFGGVESTTEV